MATPSKKRTTPAPTTPPKRHEDKKLTAWLLEQAKKLKTLETNGTRLKVDFVANMRDKGRVLGNVRNRLTDTSIRFEDWVAQTTDLGYSTALLWIDVAEHFDMVKARFADSNPLELTVRQIRDAIRDERQAQGKGKPRSGKRKAATTLISAHANETVDDAPVPTAEEPNGNQKTWERETVRAEAEAENINKGMSQKRQDATNPCQNILATLDEIDKGLATVTILGISLEAPQRDALARILHTIMNKARSLLDDLKGNKAKTKPHPHNAVVGRGSPVEDDLLTLAGGYQ